MDKNTTTMERRFSFNTSTQPQPIAESTCLNGSRSMMNASQFPWGGTQLSPKNRSNSSVNLSHTSPSRGSNKLNVKKMDPRMYADVESSGLASRIVKYHEHGSRLSRSMSTSNLYKKPGDFPIVHLQKTELPYRAAKPNLTMTRIAPPEKSMFQGNTLTSLLRSNSIISLKKSDEEISRENRPILHPPPTEGEMAPTRSSLDVLKEISRKRINSDDVDTNDSMKKYCNRDPADTLDQSTLGYETATRLGPASAYAAGLTPSQKRQRESMNGVIHPAAKSSSSFYMTQQPQHMSPQRLNCSLAGNGSPEQVAKRRQCSYNNDITSSLSSSTLQSNKRKLYDIQRRQKSLNASMLNTSTTAANTSDEQDQGRQHKMAKQQPATQSDVRAAALGKSLSYGAPVTPLPATPQNGGPSQPGDVGEPASTNLGTPKRSASTPLASAVPKPKLTLFNAKCDDDDLAATSSPSVGRNIEEANDAVERGDAMGIQFVKPKKKLNGSGTTNPLIQRTQKSKLALMLCGLRGELYQGDDEEAEASQPAAAKPTEKQAGDVTDAAKASSGTAATPSVASSAAGASPVTQTQAAASTTNSGIVGINSLKAAPKTSMAVVAPSFSLTPSSTTGSSTAASSSTSTISFAAPTAAMKSPLVGLKVSPTGPVATAAATTTVETSTAPAAASFSFGLASGGTQSTNNPAVAASTAAATTAAGTATTTTAAGTPQLMGFSFGAPKTTTSDKPAAAAGNATPAAGGFAFGAPKAATTSTAGGGGFTFGAVAASTASSATTTATATSSTTTTSSTATPTFGSVATAAAAAPTTSAPTFSFGSATAATTTAAATPATTQAAAPVFGSASTGFGATTTPAFGATTTPSFGATATPAFGSTGSTPAFGASTAPAFGASATPAFGASTTPAFGASATPSFGANAAPTFGASTTPAFGATATPVFGAATTTSSTEATASKPFAFGTANQASTTQTSGGAFAFGAASSTKPAAAAAPFSFSSAAGAAPAAAASGPAATATSAFSFGGAAANNAAPANPATTTAPAFSFGAAAKPSDSATGAAGDKNLFAFGATAAAPAAQTTTTSLFGGDASKPTATGGGFTFGAASAATTTAATPATQTPQSNPFGATTGVVKPSFSFGGAAGGATVTAAAPDASKSLFGGMAATPASTNVFGGSSASAASQSQSFSFGSAAAAAPATNSAAPNFFGGAANTAANPLGSNNSNNNANLNTSKPFAFGASASGSMITPIKPTPAPGNLFAFGGAATGAASNTNAGDNKASATNTVSPFSFGSPVQPAAAANKPFAFGSTPAPAQPAAAQPNLFAAGNTAAPGAFNFSAGAGTPAPQNPGGMFAPPAGGGERHIRRATRRLHKS